MHAAPPSPFPSWLRSSSVAWGGALLSLVVVLLVSGFMVYDERALEENEVQRAELYARVLQDHGERTFNTVDIALAALADNVAALARTRDTARFDQELSEASGGLPFMRSLSLITAGGRVIASSAPGNVGVVVDASAVRPPPPGAADWLGASVTGRDLVDIQAGRTAPAVGSRNFIPLVRRVDNEAGEALFIVAVLNPDFFGNAYELTLADPTRAAAIFSIDAVMLAATGNVSKAPGQRAPDLGIFTRYLPARESGSYLGSGIDGTPVVTAFRVLRKRPLVIVVEHSHAHVLAALHKTLFWAVGVGAGAQVLIVALMFAGWRSLRANEAVQAALEATRTGVDARERDLRVLVESVHELIFRADAKARITFVNGRWQQLTQRPVSDVLGQRLTDLCRDDERSTCNGLFATPAIQDETLLIHVAHADGRWLTLDLSVSRVANADGSSAGFAGFAVDVSAREAAKQALEAQLKFSAQLLEVIPTAIFVKDTQGKFVMVNRAWLELMDLTRAEAVGRDSTDLFGPDAAKHRAQDERLLGCEERISYENRLVVGGRAPRDTVVTKVRFTRADGTPAGIVGSIIDVTEFREAERNIRVARDAAQLANGAKSEFIANISHELRTPLQGIIGFSEIGRDLAGEQPDFLDLFSDIHAGGQRMLTLVNGLLDVALMDSAVGSLPLQRADISQIVRDAVLQLQPKSVVRNLKVHLNGLAAPVEADVDRVRFQQAVRNVLANAVRYSPVGGVVDVSLRDQGPSGIELLVRDHGPGIPPAELELIFDAFVQSSRTRDGSGGTGLGLTIARKILSAHGGSVVAANASGGGALVSICLPAAGAVAHSQADLHGQDCDGLLLASEVTR